MLEHCGSRAAAQLWPVASPRGGGRCRQRAPGGGGRTPAPAIRPWRWRWLLLLFLPSPLLLCDRWGRAVCGVQRLTKRGDQIGNQSSPGAGWPGACLPATSRSGRSRGMKQLLPFSPRSCLGFYFYFSQDRVAGEGSQGRRRKERRQKASTGMHGRKPCTRGGEERRDGQLREAFVPAFFPAFSDFYLASCLLPSCSASVVRCAACTPQSMV